MTLPKGIDEGLGDLLGAAALFKNLMTRANRSYENYFLNGRYIKSQVIEKALEEAYKDYVVPGTYPVTILHIRMDPQVLDVNVHPTKMEVRFSAEEQVREAVFEAVSRKLRESNLTASLHIEPPRSEPPAMEAKKADPAEEALLAELMRLSLIHIFSRNARSNISPL